MRIRTILAAAAAPAALAGVLLGTAGQASAATVPNPKSIITLDSQGTADSYHGVFPKNIDVPQGVRIQIDGGVINGNATVEGQLAISGVTVNGNVTVSDLGDGAAKGSASGLSLYNNASHITGNLWVHDSAGGPNGNGSNNGTSFFTNATQTGASQVDGNFTFTGNTGWLQVGAVVHVNGNFTASGNGPYGNPVGFVYDGVHADHVTSVAQPVFS